MGLMQEHFFVFVRVQLKCINLMANANLVCLIPYYISRCAVCIGNEINNEIINSLRL